MRDPTGIVESAVVLSPVAFLVASFLNGTNTLLDIQYQVVKHTEGIVLPEEQIREIVDFLDENGFLLTERFRELARETVEAFRRADLRAPYLAGEAYPDDADGLRSFLDGLFIGDGAPGEKPRGVEQDAPPLRGLVAPHIDFERGGAAYAHAYLRLARAPTPKTAIVFGVAHAAPSVPFILTRKGYATPLGDLAPDMEIIDRLAAAAPGDPFADELMHRAEHSIEFQAVMLAHLFGTDIKIVPILCGGIDVDENGNRDPKATEKMEPLLAVCRECVAERGEECLVIAAADLAHVGRRFGDGFDIDDAIVEQVRSRDTEDLARLTALTPDAWYASVMKDGNARRVCGHGAIYATLKSVDGIASEGELLHYGYAPDPAGGIVSFAALSLT